MSLQLQGISGSVAGQTITLPPGGGVIGRGSGCAVVLADELASRQHASFQPVAGGWAIVDLGSTNGTRVNGRTIVPQQPVSLRPGDRVEIGTSAFVAVLISADVAPLSGRPAGAGAPAASGARSPVLHPPLPAAAQPAASASARKAGLWTWMGRLLAALGGGLLIAGAFLPWLQVTITPTLFGFTLGERSTTVDGMQGFGPLTLGVGALLVVLVAVDALFGSGSRWPGVVYLLLVGAGIAVMGIGAATFEASSQQIVQQLGNAFGVDLSGVLESPAFDEILTAIGSVVQPELALREGVLVTAAGLLLALLGSISRLSNR